MRGRMTVSAIGAAVASFGCGSRQPPAPASPHEEPQAIVDVGDRCPMLPNSCLDDKLFRDDDGCPDSMLEIYFEQDSTTLARHAAKILDAITREEKHLRDDLRILVGGETAPGEAPGLDLQRALVVVSALRIRGVPASRLVPGLASVQERRPAAERRVVIECDGR